MTATDPSVAQRPTPLLAFASLVAITVICGAWSVIRGQDVNFDQRNYHLYDVWALLHGRIDVDLAPAGIQTFIPHYHNVPFFLLMFRPPPKLTGFVMGAWQGVVVWLAACIAWRLMPGWPWSLRAPTAGAIAILGAWSPTVITNMGTTFGDVVTAAPVLLALLVLCRDDGTFLRGHCMGGRASLALLPPEESTRGPRMPALLGK
jgi:hypothetical protein